MQAVPYDRKQFGGLKFLNLARFLATVRAQLEQRMADAKSKTERAQPKTDRAQSKKASSKSKEVRG